MKLDKKDRKLLYYLSTDARAPISILAKKLSLSRNSVKYRIERLKTGGIIRNYTAVVNLGALKLETFTMLLRFNDDIYENKDIIDYFTGHPYSDWVVSLSGNWDIFVEFTGKDHSHIMSMISDVVADFGELLNEYRTSFSFDTLRVEHLVSDFYKDLEMDSLPRAQRTADRYEIDLTDRKILGLLSSDSSAHFLDLARKLDVSIDVIRYRMKSLESSGIIIKYFPEISLDKLGYQEYLCVLRLRDIVPGMLAGLRSKISADDSITYAFFDIASATLVFVCAFQAKDGIDRLQRGIRKIYSDIIAGQECILIKEQLHFNLFPRGLVPDMEA